MCAYFNIILGKMNWIEECKSSFKVVCILVDIFPFSFFVGSKGVLISSS